MQIFKPFQTLFPCSNWWVFFSFFVRGNSVNRQKFHILLILTGKNASEWLEWCMFWVWGMLIPVAQVSSLYNKCFLKHQTFRQKFHILLILTGKNASKWLEWHVFRVWACWIQWHLFQVSMISSSWNIKISGKNLYVQIFKPVDLPIWALTVEMWNCHSWPLDTSTGGVDLPVDLPIWALTVEMWNCSWSANMSFNSRNVKLPFLTTRCQYKL